MQFVCVFVPVGINTVTSTVAEKAMPMNAVVRRGGRFRTFCSSSNFGDTIEFTHHTHSGNFTIYDDGSVSHSLVPEAARYHVYVLQVDTAKRTTLEISSVEQSDAGSFSCKISGNSTYYYFQLTVLGR